MITTKKNAEELNINSISLSDDLILSSLSAGNMQIDGSKIIEIDNVDLKNIKNIDSAGLAYLAQLKMLNPKLSFSGYSEKIMLLSTLYGLNFLFNK